MSDNILLSLMSSRKAIKSRFVEHFIDLSQRVQ